MDKYGPYIKKLMSTILDFKEDEFVRGLAIEELRRLNTDIEEFLRKQYQQTEENKQLLQEDK